MTLRSLAFVLVAAAMLVSACSTTPPVPPPADRARFNLPDATAGKQAGDLRVAPLDLLEIKVFGVTDLDGAYQVDPDGRIKMPLVGVVEAKGYTIFELAKTLETKLGATYLQNPQVTVRISEASGQQMTVEGAVAKPGMYPVRGPLTLLQALAVSGGPTENADPKRVVVFRMIEGRREAGGFDLTKIRSGRAEDPPVFGNDIIVVDGSEIKSGYSEFIKAVPLLGLFIAMAP
jgi:polysaccharide export outer membrane protein